MDAELIASRLFDEYTTAAQRGERPNVEDYLPRCPESHHQDLREACAGVDFLLRYVYVPKISQIKLDALFAEIQAMQAGKTA